MLWIRIQYFSLAVLLDPLAWKLGPARINQEDGTHDLACVRAALGAISASLLSLFAPYCPLHGIRGYDLSNFHHPLLLQHSKNTVRS